MPKQLRRATTGTAWWYALLGVAVAGSVWVVAAAPRQATAAGRLRVVTFNIHKGADRDERYDLQRTIAAIAGMDADVIGLQEVMRNYAGAKCDDQPARIADGLRRLTRRPWTYVFVPAWTGEGRSCLQRGRGDGAETEGLAFFAPARLTRQFVRLPHERLGLVVRSNLFPQVPVLVTHLTASRRNQRQRADQVARLLPWAQAQGAAIVMGDFNARPGTDELLPLVARYRDAWLEGRAAGVARGVAGGSTRPGIDARIDYVLYAAEAGLALESVESIDTTDAAGGQVSDHRPVVATFRVGTASRTFASASSSSARYRNVGM